MAPTALTTHWIDPRVSEAVLFDVDGTLAETELEGHLPAFNEAFSRLDIPWNWSADQYQGLLKITGGLERMRAHAQGLNEGQWQSAQAEEKLMRAHQLKNILYAERMALGLISPRPGIPALIEQVISAGLQWGIVTTTSRANWEALWRGCLSGFGLSEPDVVICGEDVSRKKPDPEAYRKALEHLGLKGHSCLALEDSPNGLLAAVAAEVPCVVVTSAFFQEGPWPDARAVLSSPLELQVGEPA